MLERLQADDKDKEDMNRKGGKPASRIPTFHKRPISTSQTTELPAPQKDPPVHVAQPPEKAGSVEPSKSKPPDVRETALPLPSVRVPKTSFEAPSPFSSTEQAATAAHSPVITAPKSYSEPVRFSSMIASPRPALRPEQGSEQHEPEQDTSKTLEADTVQDVSISQLPCEGSISQKPPEDIEIKSRITLTASGDTEKSEPAAEVNQEGAIMDEQPPWETEPMNTLEFKDSRSSSDVECEDDSADEKSEGHDSGEVKEHLEPLISQSEFSNCEEERADESSSPVAPEKPAKAKSTKSAKVSYVVLLA